MLLSLLIATSIIPQTSKVDWKVYRLEGTTASAEFPSAPTLRPHGLYSNNNSNGNTAYSLRLYGLQWMKEQSGLVLVYTDLTHSEQTENFLPGFWDNHVVKSKLITEISRDFRKTEKGATLDGTYHFGNSVTARVRLILDGNRLYQQLATWPNDKPNPDRVNRFFDSLKLK